MSPIEIRPEDMERMALAADRLQQIRTSIRRSAKRPAKVSAVLLADHIQQLSAFLADSAAEWEYLTTVPRTHAASTGEMWTQQVAAKAAARALSALTALMENTHQAVNRSRPAALRRPAFAAAPTRQPLNEIEAELGRSITLLRTSRAGLVRSVRERAVALQTVQGPVASSLAPARPTPARPAPARSHR